MGVELENQPGQERGEHPASSGSILRRCVQVVVAPGTLFRGLRERPRYVGAVLLGAVLVGGSSLFLPVELYEGAIRAEADRVGEELPADPETLARLAWLSGSLGGFVFWILLTVGFAGLATLLFSVVLGDNGRFRQYLAVTAHAFLIPAMGAVVTLPAKISTGDPHYSVTLATLFFFVEAGYLARVLALLDLFNLWAYGLVGLGAAAVARERSEADAVAAMLGVGLGVALLLALIPGI